MNNQIESAGIMAKIWKTNSIDELIHALLETPIKLCVEKYDEFLKHAFRLGRQSAIKETYQAESWISVNDRVPEDGKLVLVHYENGVECYGSTYNGKFMPGVIAWFEPPKFNLYAESKCV